MIPFVDISKEFELLKNEIVNKMSKVLFTSQFILGEEVEKFEQNINKMFNSKYSIGVGSGTDALFFIFKALGIGEGDEVITTPFSFIASTTAIVRAGAKPVFADIDPDTLNISPEKIEENITERTKALLIVHLFGNPCNMDRILNIAQKYKLKLIEDCAQSFGSKYNEQYVGTFGDATCFSFYPSKNLGAYGDAGMVITNSKDIFSKIKLYRNHGFNEKGECFLLGYNSRLDSIQAAILNVKIEYFNHILEKKVKFAKLYMDSFKDVEEIIPQKTEEKGFHSYNFITFRVKKRDQLKAFLEKNGISSAIYYPIPIPAQPCFKFLNTDSKSYIIATNVSNHVISLPLYPSLTEESIKNIVSKVKEFYANTR
jgi:dTDP-4-amino-4,6-dideoxygalactose transaminase